MYYPLTISVGNTYRLMSIGNNNHNIIVFAYLTPWLKTPFNIQMSWIQFLFFSVCGIQGIFPTKLELN